MNTHIEEYLKYYADLDNPQYAVLLNGSWGSGKTFFVKKLSNLWIETTAKEEDITLEPIYISLNGISKLASITEAIKAAINPFLYSKPAKVLGKLLKAAVKTAIKYDFDTDSDNKNDGSVTFNIDVLQIFKNDNPEIKGRRILILDDIERCKVETNELFGYINNFVEHSACKVILIADEGKIKKDDNSAFQYKDIKEKLIGQTFEIVPDVESALNSFLMETIHELDLTIYSDMLRELFAASDLKNLRVLKQAILDYSRLLKLVADKYRQDEQFDHFVKNLLFYFTLVYTEFKTGNEDIEHYQNYLFWGDTPSPGKLLDDKYDALLARYKIYNSAYVLSISEILSYIKTGSIDVQNLNSSLEANIFFRKEKEKDWETLWSWPFIEDDALDSLLPKVWSDFKEGKIASVSEIFHHAGIFISLLNAKLFSGTSKAEVVKLSKKSISKILETYVGEHKEEFIYGFMNSSWGKQYLCYETKEFISIKAHFDSEVQRQNEVCKLMLVQKLFDSINDDNVLLISEDLQKIDAAAYSVNPSPIFNKIDIKSFASAIRNLSNRSIDYLRVWFHSRYHPEEKYTNVILNEPMKDEVVNLKRLNTLVSNKLVGQRLKSRMLSELSNELKKIIKKLDMIPTALPSGTHSPSLEPKV